MCKCSRRSQSAQPRIVHRDLKPETSWFGVSAHDESESDVRDTRDVRDVKDIVTVCDFGIAQLSPIQAFRFLQPVCSNVTGEGMVVGTPRTCRPSKRARTARRAQRRVFGRVVLFQMLTRQLPFTAETPWRSP